MSSGKIFVDGTDGTTAAGQCPGGGSGGGVLILGDSISIGSSASISAEGGDGKNRNINSKRRRWRWKRWPCENIWGLPIIRVLQPSRSIRVQGGGYGGAAYGQSRAIQELPMLPAGHMPSYTVGSELLAGPFSVLSNKDTVCAGTPVTLTVTNPGSITWSTGDTIDSTIVTPMATTSYYVYGTSASGCITSDTTEIFVPTPAVDLGPDTNNCGPITLRRGANGWCNLHLEYRRYCSDHKHYKYRNLQRNCKHCRLYGWADTITNDHRYDSDRHFNDFIGFNL